jgi:GxxExxY protein
LRDDKPLTPKGTTEPQSPLRDAQRKTKGIKMTTNQLTSEIIGSAIEVHRILGPGLLESAYEICLARELSLREIACERQKKLPITYKGVEVSSHYRIDLLVADKVVVEIKAVERLAEIHQAQILSYMRLGEYGIGLLLNFNVPLLKDGIRRFVL